MIFNKLLLIYVVFLQQVFTSIFVVYNIFAMKKTINYIKIFVILLFIVQCAKIDPVTGEKVIIEPNTVEKARENARKGGGLFGDFTGNKNTSNTFEFSTSNVLWRATLNSLDFLPLINADYSGGIIVYDWFSNKNDNQSIKISVRFLSNELKSSSVVIAGHKKVCDDMGKCFVEKLDNKFTNEIKESIILNARQIKIEDSKKDSQK